jgi:DNA-damage-inducible protein D
MTNKDQTNSQVKQADPASSPFDQIRRVRSDGSEYWTARELMPNLGYAIWQNMSIAINRAKASCTAQGYDLADNFIDVNKVIQPGKTGPSRQDYELTRYAC